MFTPRHVSQSEKHILNIFLRTGLRFTVLTPILIIVGQTFTVTVYLQFFLKKNMVFYSTVLRGPWPLHCMGLLIPSIYSIELCYWLFFVQIQKIRWRKLANFRAVKKKLLVQFKPLLDRLLASLCFLYLW